jgi:hypothetical protein
MNTYRYKLEWRTFPFGFAAKMYIFASLFALMMLTPGATMSGFIRPSKAGPREENSARLLGP